MLFRENKQLTAFIFLFLAGLIIASAILFQTYTINSSYEKPSPLMVFPTLFFYLSFSIIAFIFPWSWKKAKETVYLKIIFIILTCLVFIIGFILISSVLEWATSKREYSLWKGFMFTLYHSSILIFFIYALISCLLYFIGVTKEKPILKEYLTTIPIKKRGETFFINISEIQLFEANDNYISIYTIGNNQYLIRKTLSKLEEQLDPLVFQRIHRKYLVNLNYVKSTKVDPNGGYFIYLQFERTVKMSKSYKEKLKLLFPKNNS